MRATTCSTPNVSRATRAEMMLELSPLDTAANAPARSIPASIRTLLVESDADDLLAVEVGAEPAERLRVLVDHGDRVAEALHRGRERRPHPAAAHDHHVHDQASSGCSSTAFGWCQHEPTGGYSDPGDATAYALHRAQARIRGEALAGRTPFRTDRLAHTLLPKRIALPVFASDAMSSVAYAPEEILLTLSVAGVAAYMYSPWIALVGGRADDRRGRLLPAERARLPVRRRRLRGGDGQPRAASGAWWWRARCSSTTC